MASKGYQFHCSEQFPVVLNSEGRKTKASKIAAVILDYSGGNGLSRCTCLDIGCSGGTFSQVLSRLFKHVIAFDIDCEAVLLARNEVKESNVSYLLADGMGIPLEDHSVDVVVCNHVYEHVPNAQRLMDEIYRVLNNDGFCYFAAGNRFVVKEHHYNLYFLSWLPRPLANLYVKITGRADVYYEELLSLMQLKRLVSRFSIEDYTLKIITQPKKFHAEDVISEKNPLTRLPLFLLRLLYFFIPTYVWILSKQGPGGSSVAKSN